MTKIIPNSESTLCCAEHFAWFCWCSQLTFKVILKFKGVMTCIIFFRILSFFLGSNCFLGCTSLGLHTDIVPCSDIEFYPYPNWVSEFPYKIMKATSAKKSKWYIICLLPKFWDHSVHKIIFFWPILTIKMTTWTWKFSLPQSTKETWEQRGLNHPLGSTAVAWVWIY